MGFPCYEAKDAARFIRDECCVRHLANVEYDPAAKARFERNISGPYLIWCARQGVSTGVTHE
ncbi:hypothetical protein [Paraburkholderia flagellata]|uniref:hypothetical protein n=1 Tax=Paraburkholderia flagellata TaxID=2883241 RepID=UPI001F284362|nr:hypothetical protein [Paraburkholderia flagellata]